MPYNRICICDDQAGAGGRRTACAEGQAVTMLDNSSKAAETVVAGEQIRAFPGGVLTVGHVERITYDDDHNETGRETLSGAPPE